MQRRITISVVLLILMLVAVGQVWGQGGGDAEPEATPEGANLPIQELIFQTFFAAADGWPSEAAPDDQISYEVTADGYAVTSVAGGGIGSIPVLNQNLDDFYTEIVFTVDSCESAESALLFFTRILPNEETLTNDSFVYVNQCNGNYRARGLVGNEILEVATNGEGPALEEGQQYVIGYLLVGNQSALYVNGEEVARFVMPEGQSRRSGAIAPGAQLGFSYTLNAWRIWTLKSSGENLEDVPVLEVPTEDATDPVLAGELGEVLYDPPFTAPTNIPLGLHHEVAAFLIDNTFINLYNTQDVGILPFEGVDGSGYYMTIEFVIRDCSDTSTIGFVWHADEAYEDYEAFEIACNGVFRAFSVEGGVEGDVIISGEVQPALTELTPASLGVYVQDDTVFIYSANDLIDTYSTRSGSGLAGLRLTTGDDGTRMDILAGELTVFDIPVE